MAFSEIDFATSLFSKDILPIARSNIGLIKQRFKNNEIIIKVLDLFSTVPDEKEFLSQNEFDVLIANAKFGESTNNIISASYGKILAFTDNEKVELTNLVSNVIADEMISTAKYNNAGNPIGMIRQLQEFNVDAIANPEANDYREVGLDEINADDVQKETESNLLFSAFDIINKLGSFPGKGGIIDRSLNMVSGPPGGGKSLYMMQEAFNVALQGKKVYYAAIGDMNEFHFMTRMSSQNLKMPIMSVTMQIKYYWEVLKQQFPQVVQNMRLAFFPPDTLTTEDFVAILKKKGYYDSFDAFFIDYDTNFKSDEEMYQKGESTYNCLKKLADRPGKFVWVGCQPKQVYWGNEILPKEASSESSRKQQIVDTMITISNPPSPGGVNHIGIINVPKNRAGATGCTPYLMDRNLRLEPISYDLYGYLKVTTDAITLPGSGCESMATTANSGMVVEH